MTTPTFLHVPATGRVPAVSASPRVLQVAAVPRSGGGSATPAAHHLTHEPGGSDALTSYLATADVATITQRGTRAAQPAASAVVAGTLYCVTDEGAILERSSGTVWEAYGPLLWGTGAVRFRYIHSTTTTAPPTGNQVRFNAAHPYTSVTSLWIRNLTTDGIDTHGIMLVLTTGTTVYVQDRATSAQYALFTMTGDPVDHTDYVELPVTWKNNGSAIPNANGIEVVFLRFEA